ncbi:hypothetical protein M378DRAFT_16968 [Amanita muscaria Koide BX008]|uniref:Uncharacterized protein n=1 Tax=Amanita muscaria (strain Koide BX008) TaxID=946122 RepID=A0A0C2SRI1_AMAMK|nr:hypothetical protein M378DRAFT_16968 [Amanita muscaria Koide BX008]
MNWTTLNQCLTLTGGSAHCGPVQSSLSQFNQFIRLNLETLLAVGHRVSVELTRCAPDDVLIFPDILMPAEKVGTVTDIHFDTVSVQDLTTGVIEEIPVRDLRRMFNIGDTVKVHSPVSLHHLNLEGWVVNTDEDIVTVVHGKTKEQVSVKSWQLVPIELDFILHENSSSSEPLPRSLRGYDPYKNLVNSRVVIGGLHHEKGLCGRREYGSM